ncbi:ABC transporter permease [Streptomyces corynorhini]|uniref:ABC transporter permease n=1 Tax=Streptomyces corynorhini TaxID=2282652 RepID=A0A370B7W1_9ACTN|nr:ABC transporter permease [Streptomyces corynorhini]RDG37897.1 ABC transporter permease [Streptomyces corynorhini]
MFRTALRNVLSHKARLLMTVLAVMLGVAFVSGTLIFTDTLGNAFHNQSAKSYKDVAVGARVWDTRDDESDSESDADKGTPGVDQKTVDRIGELTGVASVTSRVSGFAGVGDPDGKLIGNGWSNTGGNFTPGKDGKDPAYDFTEGAGPTEAGQVALDKDTAARGKYKVGETVRVATNGPVKEYTLSGIFTTEDGAVNAGGSLVLFDTDVAQKLYLEPGYFSELSVTAEAGASHDEIRAQVVKLLPEDSDVATGEQLAEDQARDIENGLSSLNQMLLAFAGIALFVGVFLISNTFTMLVAQRTKELALLRAVGASRRQIKRSVLIEAGVVGVVASVVGFLIGLGLAIGLRSAMGLLDAKVPAGPLVVSPTAVVAAFAVGVLITVLAAWLPARKAAKIPPVAAMGSAHLPSTTRSLIVRNSIGGLLALIGSAVIVLGAAADKDGGYIIGGGAFLTMIAVIVLIPLLSRPVIALVRPLLSSVFGVSGKLASLNAARNPRRTGATASALAIGLTLVTTLTVVGITVGTAIDKSTSDNIRADYQVSMAGFDSIDPSAVDALRKAPGVSALSPRQMASFETGDDYRNATALAPAELEKLFNITTVSGSLSSMTKDANTIAISEEIAKSEGWKPGDTVPAKFGDGKKEELKVGAVIQKVDFLGELLTSTELADRHQAKPYITEIWVKMAGGESTANEQALVDALGKNPAISIKDMEGIKNEFSGIINTMLNILYALLGMALIIAVLGVVNTLAMSVFERQQEIGMLRAIGLDRTKVKRMIRLEAVVISVFGALIGVGLGTFLGWAIGETIKGSIPNYALVIPWDRIAVFMALAAVVGMLAALWPARSAARLNMLTAIKTE